LAVPFDPGWSGRGSRGASRGPVSACVSHGGRGVITTSCQRWTARRCSPRPAGEPIDPRRYEVAPMATDTEAKRFVVEHHCSGSYPAARRRFGLYRGPELVGVAVFSQPWGHVLAAAGVPFDATETLELSRFVLLD